jgi:hypothetical protein
VFSDLASIRDAKGLVHLGLSSAERIVTIKRVHSLSFFQSLFNIANHSVKYTAILLWYTDLCEKPARCA